MSSSSTGRNDVSGQLGPRREDTPQAYFENTCTRRSALTDRPSGDTDEHADNLNQHANSTHVAFSKGCSARPKHRYPLPEVAPENYQETAQNCC